MGRSDLDCAFLLDIDLKFEQEGEQQSNRRLIYSEESIETRTAIDFFVMLKRPQSVVLTLVQPKNAVEYLHLLDMSPTVSFAGVVLITSI